MTRKINLKLVRDIRFSPWLFAGVLLMVASGVALWDATYLSYLNLGKSYERSYERLHMADFTVDMQSAPEQVVGRVLRIPGVMQTEGRYIEDLEVEQKNIDPKRITGRIISIPDKKPPSVNQLLLIRGNMPSAGNKRELLLESGFAKRNNYRPGDFIYPVVNGDQVRFRISGIIKSPEYILVLRSRDQPMPNPKHFCVMFMRKEMTDRLLGSFGAINQVQVAVKPGARRETVMRAVREALRSYNADDPLPMEKQAGYERLAIDLKAMRNLAIFFPVLFLGIASLSIYNLLGRMVHTQRPQIGFMRAVGYSRTDVLHHYTGFAVLIGVLGSAIGSVLGYRMGIGLTLLFSRLINVPYYDMTPRPGPMALGVGVAVAATFLAGILPAMAAAQLTPAEAIRTDVPTGGRVPAVERAVPALGRMSYTWRLPFRNLFRSPKRTFSTVIGIASAITLILVSSGLIDSSAYSIRFYFDKIQRYDVLASFLHPETEHVIGRVRTWKGVERAEPFLEVPVKIVHDGQEHITVIYGNALDCRLLNLTAPDGTVFPVPRTGIAMGSPTIAALGLSLGQSVTLTLPESIVPELADAPIVGGDSSRYREEVMLPSRSLQQIEINERIPIACALFGPIGDSTIMNIDEVRRIYGRAMELPPNATNGIMVRTDGVHAEAIRDRLYDIPGVVVVVNMADVRVQIDEMLKTFTTFVNVMLGFAMVLAIIIVFNATTMNILERTREIASMRALGVSVWRVAGMVTIENLCTWLAGTIIGLPIGMWLADEFVKLYVSDSFHMQTHILPKTYTWTIVGILAAVLISQIPGIYYLSRLDLAKATKEVSG